MDTIVVPDIKITTILNKEQFNNSIKEQALLIKENNKKVIIFIEYRLKKYYTYFNKIFRPYLEDWNLLLSLGVNFDKYEYRERRIINMNITKPEKDTFIKIWKYENAPDEYKYLSPHGGDEDYVAFVPDEFTDMTDYDEDKIEEERIEFPYVPFIQSGSPFGCCDVSHHKVSGGWVFIGAHS